MAANPERNGAVIVPLMSTHDEETETVLVLVEHLRDCAAEYDRLLDATYGNHPARLQLGAEFASTIHNLQARVMMLDSRRRYPDRLA